MNRTHLLCGLIAAVCMTAGPVLAETYMLKNGDVIEGKMLRTEGSKITLRTSSGVLNYDVKAFHEETRLTHFKDVPLHVQKPVVKKKSKSWIVVFFEKLPKASTVVIIIGVIMISGGGIWMTMAAYDVSPNWGLALVMSGGSAELAFMFKHWDRACWPLLTQACGIAVCISAVLLA